MIRTIQTNDGKITHTVEGNAAAITTTALCIAWNCAQAVNVYEGEPSMGTLDQTFGDWGMIDPPANEAAFNAKVQGLPVAVFA